MAKYKNTGSLQRTKKKKEGESYLIKERQRRMQYYKPSRELTRTQRIKRNKKNMQRNIAQVVSKEKKKRRYNKIRDMTYEDESEDIECFNKWQ